MAFVGDCFALAHIHMESDPSLVLIICSNFIRFSNENLPLFFRLRRLAIRLFFSIFFSFSFFLLLLHPMESTQFHFIGTSS